MTYNEARPPFIIPEIPPYQTKNKQTSLVDWDAVEDWAKAHPGEWFRIIHKYRSPSSARFSTAQQSKKRNLEYRATTHAKQEDGKIGLFIRYNPKGK